MPERGGYVPIEDIPPDRQSMGEVVGSGYVAWGIPQGSLLHAVRYGRYETASSPGRFLICRDRKGELVSTFLRKVGVDVDGGMVLEAPSGDGNGSDEVEIAGLVVRTVLPSG